MNDKILNNNISIIIPNYNSEKYIEETLQSIENQTSPNWECIIVDDGSNDNSFNIIEQYTLNDKRFRLLKRNREPKGECTSRNIGIENAKSKYVMFLDADDLLVPSCVENRLSLLKDKTDLLITGTDHYFPDGTRKLTRRLENGNNYIAPFLRFEFLWQVCSVTWNREFLNNIGNFNENYVNMVDPELHIRALKNPNINVIYKPEYRDTLYRQIPQRKDYKEDIYYYKMTSSLINLSKENITNFKNSNYITDVKYGLGRVLANLVFYKNNFKKKNDEIQGLIDYIEAAEITTAFKMKLIKDLFRINNILPKFLNQKIIRFLNRKLFIYILIGKFSLK